MWRSADVGEEDRPKIRDEVWKMRYFSRNGIFRPFWAVQRWLVSRQPTLQVIFSREG